MPHIFRFCNYRILWLRAGLDSLNRSLQIFVVITMFEYLLSFEAVYSKFNATKQHKQEDNVSAELAAARERPYPQTSSFPQRLIKQ